MHAKHFLLLAVLSLSTGASAQSLNGQSLPTPYASAVQGTYTFVVTALQPYSVMYNMKGQQVGFCHNAALPFGYSCELHFGQEIYTGKLVADGAGNIASTSTLVVTSDPNAYKCSGALHAVATCPYVVPSTNVWNSSTTYAVGAVVIYPDTNGTTVQAIAANTNAVPVLITNGSNPQVGNTCRQGTFLGGGLQPKCTWVVLPNSAVGKNDSGSTTMSGTYTVNANGLGTMQLTAVGGTPSSFQLLVPPHAAAQQIQVYAKPTLGNDAQGSGTAVLQ